MKHGMMVFGGRWFRHYQKWLLLFANTLLGRLVLGIPLNAPQVRKLTPEMCAWSRDGVHFEARLFAGKQYANRLYFALKPLWWCLHAIDCLSARWDLQVNFGFDTLNIYSPDGSNSTCGYTQRSGVNETFATIVAGAGTAVFNDNYPEAFIRASTTSSQFQDCHRGIITFKTGAILSSISPAPKSITAITVTALRLGLYSNGKTNGLGSSSLAIVSSNPASRTTLVAADQSTLGSTAYATIAYADYANSVYNYADLNSTALAALDLSATHFCIGLRLEWDRAASFGGTWASGAYSSYVVCNAANKYPCLTLAYTIQPPPQIAGTVVNTAGGGYVAGACQILAAPVTQVKLLVADNPSLTTPVVDTGWISMAVAAGDNASILGAWVPSTAGTYYGQLSIDSTYYTITGSIVPFAVAFPSIASVTKAQRRDSFTWTVVVADTYKQPPLVSVIVDDVSHPAVLVSSSVGSYTYQSTVSVERGKHKAKVVVTNLWQTIATEYEPFYAEYALTTPGISIFAGGSKIQAWGASISDALFPDFPRLTFTSDTWILGNQFITALCYLRGIKRYEFIRRYATKNADGTWTYQCESVDKEKLEQVTSIMANAVGMQDVMAQVLTPMRLADDYASLMPGFIYETKWELTPKSTIISQLMVQAGLNMWGRSGAMYCHKRDVSLETPRFAVRMNDVLAGFSEDAQIYDWVRVWYSIARYPVVETALTNYDSANWTGTVSDALKTTDSILPASGALYCLKGTGSITRASLLAKFADFDRFKMRWLPPITTTSLSITLQTDASNKYTYTRTFAGGTGAGFNLSGGSAPDGTVLKSIALGSRRIASVTGQMTQPCTVTATTKLSGAVIWTSGAIATSGDANTWTVSIPESVYKNSLMDTLELSFTQLYYIANSYGVSCVKLDVSEYLQVSQVTGSRQYAISSKTCGYNLVPSHVNVGGTVYLKFGKTFLCAKPTLATDQSINISYEDTEMLMYVHTADGLQLVSSGAGVGIVEENGNLYATSNDVAIGANIGDVADIVCARGNIIVNVIQTAFTTVLVWLIQSWAWSSVYNLWDEIDLPLSAFTKTGSPTDLVSIILSATGDNYYDGLCLYANTPANRYVDAKSGTGLHKMPDRTGDGFGSENAARAFANGMLALVSTPAKDYSISKPLDTDIELGDPVDCDGEVLAVYGINYDFEQGRMTVQVGKRVQETLEVLKDHAERIDRLESRR